MVLLFVNVFYSGTPFQNDDRYLAFCLDVAGLLAVGPCFDGSRERLGCDDESGGDGVIFSPIRREIASNISHVVCMRIYIRCPVQSELREQLPSWSTSVQCNRVLGSVYSQIDLA